MSTALVCHRRPETLPSESIVSPPHRTEPTQSQPILLLHPPLHSRSSAGSRNIKGAGQKRTMRLRKSCEMQLRSGHSAA
jgi:hypothetical protein